MIKKSSVTWGLMLMALIVVIGLIMSGCELVVTTDSCIDCHMDKDTLIEEADPIEAIEDSGEG